MTERGQQRRGASTLRRWGLPLLLTITGIAAYANSFDGVLLYDDVPHIVENQRIRSLWPPWDLLSRRRPVVEVSLAINFALGELNPWGYHAFNLGVHLLAGLTLFGVVRRTIGYATPNRSEHSMSWIAFATAAIWIVHPLQTQCVTYIIQRGESLMGLFYLFTLYSLIRSASDESGHAWKAVAITACALGMGSKAVMVTAPLVVFAYDAVFITGNARETIRRRWALYIGLAATWVVLVLVGVAGGALSASRTGGTVGFSYHGATPWEYLSTQSGVILHYLRLSLWPQSLCLDYGWPIAASTAVSALPGIVVLALLVASAWGLLRRPPLGFLGLWFFVILAPTSSIVPIQDPAFEHRMYLSLAAVITLVVLGIDAILRHCVTRYHWSERRRCGVASVLVAITMLVLGGLTTSRNTLYADELGMWDDVVAKRPGNARARYNLANTLRAVGRFEEALAHYESAVTLNPQFALAHNNFGLALAQRGDSKQALDHFREAVRFKENYADAHSNLGMLLAKAGQLEDAVDALREAVRLRPAIVEARYNLGLVLARQGKFEFAATELREAAHLDPTLAVAHFNLGRVLAELGRFAEALEAFRKTLQVEPNHIEAQRLQRAAQAAMESSRHE